MPTQSAVVGNVFISLRTLPQSDLGVFIILEDCTCNWTLLSEKAADFKGSSTAHWEAPTKHLGVRIRIV
jgi:hypothetical protein